MVGTEYQIEEILAQIEELKKQTTENHQKLEQILSCLKDQMQDKDNQVSDGLAEPHRRVDESEAEYTTGKGNRGIKIGEIVIELGYATQAQVGECLTKQEELRQHGQNRMLLDLMLESGMITAQQFGTCLELQKVRAPWRYGRNP
jgi:hypothetical protein